MKKIIFPMAIIVSLIVFFFIIDHKEFHRYDEAQTIQKVSPTVKRNPSVSVPKTKPLTEAKPIAETNLAKPPETETKSADKTIPAGKEKPVEAKAIAVPVLTPEEAVRANREAIRFQRKRAVANAIQKLFQTIGLNNNRIHFIIALLPLLIVIDAFRIKKGEKKSNKVKEYFSLPRRVRILLSVSLLGFGILVFVPWSVYFGNSLQFQFIFQDFVNWNLRVLTISIIGACIILLLIPPIISDYLIAAISGLGLCVYVQAMFMNHYLGTMDGTEPIWSEHRTFGIINIVIWCLIVITPIIIKKVKPSIFSKAISMTTGLVLFLELLATASMVFSANQNVWSRTDAFFADGSKQFELSKNKNIVVFIFDTLSSNYIEQWF